MEDGEELEFFIVIVFLKGGERERERERENFYGLYECVQQQPLRWLENFSPLILAGEEQLSKNWELQLNKSAKIFRRIY